MAPLHCTTTYIKINDTSLPVQNSQHDLKHVLYWAHDLEKQQQHTVQPGEEGFGNKNTPCEIYLEGNFIFNGKIYCFLYFKNGRM